MDRITLDRDVFKALASDTRLDILKALDERQKTVTELARELNLNKATVFEHLEKLADVELVTKLEDERKWVYYQLSWKGRRLLHPEQITIALLLSSAFASLVTAAAVFWVYAAGRLGGGAPADDAADSSIASAPKESADAGARSADPAASSPMPEGLVSSVEADPTLLWAGVLLLALVVLLSVGAFVVWRRAKVKAAAASA